MEIIIKDKIDILNFDFIITKESTFSLSLIIEQMSQKIQNKPLDFIINAEYLPTEIIEKLAFVDGLKKICETNTVFACLYNIPKELLPEIEPIYTTNNLPIVPTESEASDMVRLNRIEFELNLPND